MSSALRSLILAFGCASIVASCSGAGTSSSNVNASGSGGSSDGEGGSSGEQGGSSGEAGVAGEGSAGSAGSVEVGEQPSQQYPDPTSCAEAAASASYMGCDFWPTVVDNMVQPLFDYAVVVANPQSSPAEITVRRGDKTIGTTTIAPGSLVKVFLPWVDALKSTTSMPFPGCPTSVKTQTVRAAAGAYHLTSSLPVAVYQFNAIEYAAKGGPPGKNWASCKVDTCTMLGDKNCYSYTNDASLLLPATALTGNYRVSGISAWKNSEDQSDPTSGFTFPPYFAVTGTQDGTHVSVRLGPKGHIAGGGGVASSGPGGVVSFELGAGEVVMVVSNDDPSGDFSGTLVSADKPVQVISGIACTQNPHGKEACDHLEESVLPAETLGKRYFVTAPSAPYGGAAKYHVRLVGNVDGTKLSYPGTNPGAPSSLDAGQVVDLGLVTEDFEVVGDQAFAVAVFQVGADLVDQGSASFEQKGDPSQSFVATVGQFRTSYIFLAPDDYDVSYADIVQPLDAKLTLDGQEVTVAPVPISSGYGIARVQLGAGNKGAHQLVATKPVGLQVSGYGAYTSYQYPGGLNLGKISPPPVH